jgi:O-antigen/teichoic acid export membrane protein
MEYMEATNGMKPKQPAPASRLTFLSRAARISSSQAIRRTARFLFLFVAARKLGPELFGLYALLLATIETTSLISGEGLIDYLTREVAKRPERAESLFWRVTQLRLLYALVLFPVVLIVLRSLRYSGSVLIDASWLLLILFFRSPFASAQGIIRAVHRVTQLVWLEAVQASCLLGIGFFLLSRHADIHSVIWAEVFSSLVVGLVAIPTVKSLWPRHSRSDVPRRDIFRATFAFNLYPLIANIYDRVDVILLSVLAGNFAAGIYALPYRALATLQLLPLGLMTAVLPSISSSANSESDETLCSRMVSSLYVLSLFPVLIVTLLAEPLVFFVLGRHYAESVPILRILIWAAIPMFINYALNTYLLARSQERLFLYTNSVCAAINIVGNFLLIPHFSYFAAAVMTVITETVLLIQNVAIIKKKFGFLVFPKGVVLTSLVFVLLLAAGVTGSYYFPSPILTAAIPLLFLTYLYFDGSLRSMVSWMSPSLIAS